MRLTLRTMLAYLDNVRGPGDTREPLLSPADAEELGRKIRESDFASGLVDRIRAVMKKLRMDAPKLDGKGMGNDANTVAEYLDSALPQDRVGDFERVCLESDKHLCEVAACHQILTLVLGKPAEVPPELRERIYALGHPETLAEQRLAGAAAPPPPPPTNGRPAEMAQSAAPLEVPEYLRAGRERSIWPLAGAIALTLLLGVVVLALSGRLGPSPSERPIAEGPPPAENGKPPVSETPPAVERPSSDNDKSAKSPDVPPETPPAEPPPAPAPAATAPEVATTVPASLTPDSVPPVPAAPPPVPDVPETAPKGDARVADATGNAGSKVKIRVAPVPEAAEPQGVGRLATRDQLVATFNPGDGVWYAKPPSGVLVAGERLVVLPPYRPQIALPSAVQLTFAGESALMMHEPGPNNVPNVSIEYGRVLAITGGKAGAEVNLDLGGVEGLLALADADSLVAIRVARVHLPGYDLETMPGVSVVELYNAHGRATWHQRGGKKVDLRLNYRHFYVNDDTAHTEGPFVPPDWIDPSNDSPVDREHALKLFREIKLDRPLDHSLLELTKHRQVELRSMSARCLAALGDFEPILREFNDGRQAAYWDVEFKQLRRAMAQSTATAAAVHATLRRLRPAYADDLYGLLIGFSPQDLSRGASAELVKLLEHDEMDLRVLAHMNLVTITGVWGFYRPEKPPAQQRTSIQNWKDRGDKGQIAYRQTPSPFDIDKPLPAPSGEARPPGVPAVAPPVR